MDLFAILFVIGILILFGLFVFYMVRSEKKERLRRSQVAQSLGFTPIEPEQDFVDRITQIYQNRRGKSQYELRNVSHKVLPDGDMYLFDLVETSGEDDSYIENQAVAFRSPYLNLPFFMLFPQADMEGAGVKIANQILRWAVTKVGNPVDFPEYPEFQRRYLVSSSDPEGTRNFLEASKIHLLTQTYLCIINAGGDMFTLSKFIPSGKTHTVEAVSERISQGMDVFQIFSR